MTPAEKKYSCIHEELIQDHSLQLKTLEAEIEFKKEKIDDLKTSVENIENKLDQLIQKSQQDDFNIDNRVTKVENTLNVLKWVTGIGLTSIGTAVTVITLLLTILH